MQEIFIDFETYYDKAYSLTKMTTPEYICDPRFKVMGVSLAVNDGPSQWYEELPDLDYENSNVIAYNCYFDAMILTLHYGRKAKRYTCSAALARYWLPDQHSYALKAIAPALGLGHKLDALVEGSDVVNKELIEYANNDNDLNRAIYREIIPHIDEFEREVHSITLRWGVEPTLQGDIALFEQASELAIAERAKLIDESGVAEDVLVSNKKFCEFVEQELTIEVARKGQLQTPCLAKGDPEFQAMITKHAEYKKIWDARLAAKSTINITRPQALANVCKLTPNNGLPMPLKWCGASTTRWSGSDGINVQNLPNGSVARTAIVAPPGHVIVVVDSSQIELRLNAWWSKEVKVLDMLDTGKCLYIAAAAKHYGKEYDNFTKKSPERKLGKAITLGSGYGMGWERFRDWCASGPLGMEPMLLPDDEAKKAIYGYREANANIVANWREHDKYIKMMYDVGRVKTKSGFFKTETTRKPKKIGPIVIEHNAICLPNGLRMWYKNLEKKQVKLNGKDRDAWMYNTKDYIYGARLQENCVQGLARVVISDQLLMMEAEGIRTVSSTHDEILAVCPEQDADKILARMIEIMSTTPEWAILPDYPKLTLAAEGGYARNYSK
jgi:DNA polymerase